MRVSLLVVAALALIGFVVVAVVVPQTQGAKAKEAAQALVAGAGPAQQQVTSIVEKSGNLSGAGRGVKIAEKSDPKAGRFKWIVADDGAIRGWNEENALEVALTPSVQAGKVSWTCKGYPLSAMPAACIRYAAASSQRRSPVRRSRVDSSAPITTPPPSTGQNKSIHGEPGRAMRAITGRNVAVTM